MKVEESWKKENGNYECPFCKEEFSKKAIGSHIYRKHEKSSKNIRSWSYFNNDLNFKLKAQKAKEEYLNEKLGKFKDFEVCCTTCNKIFIVNEREKQHPKKEKYYCSRSCANKRTFSDETKKKKSKSALKYYKNNNIDGSKKIFKFVCDVCGKTYERNLTLKRYEKTSVRYCSAKCKNTNPEYRKKLSDIAKERVASGKHKGWASRNILSYPEKFFVDVLTNNNIFDKCKTNYVVSKKDLGVENDDSNYFLDFYFPDLKLDLEIDGKQHNQKDRKLSDEKRDLLLNNHGITVYRIKWKGINSIPNKEYIKKEIDKFLDFYKNLCLD